MAEKRIVLISGPIASGKSELARRLSELAQSAILKTKDVIRARFPKVPLERGPMQRAGDKLDRDTAGKWVATELGHKTLGDVAFEKAELIVVDAVRIKEQVDEVRKAFSSTHRVVHIHVWAPQDELERRFKERQREGDPETYEGARTKTERGVASLRETADISINSQRCRPEDVVAQAVASLGLNPRSVDQCVDVLIGGQYGSEGKGNIASYLAKEYGYLVRVGGPNAGHMVKLSNPSKPQHTYHHLPSGTQHNTEAKLILGPGAQINVERLMEEIADSFVTADRLSIDPQAVIIEQSDIDEERGPGGVVGSIASTGQGVGICASRRILARNGRIPIRLAADIPVLKPFVRPTLDILEQAYASGERIMLEGTQGTGLSIFHGNYPHVTSRDTTASGCMAEAGIAARRVRRVIMVCRTYPIRVGKTAGDSGPMGQEITWDIVAERSGLSADDLKQKEVGSTTKRPRRVAEFDWVQLRRSVMLNAPTDIALTFVDHLSAKNADARRYEQLDGETIRFIEAVERLAQVPVSLINTRFHLRSVIDRRNW
jgi:adenylosuccinate synthase